METSSLERTLTELDHVRLTNLLRRAQAGGSGATAGRALEALLDGCAVVPSRQAPPDVVTMYAQVLLQDLQTGQRSTLAPCYPPDADPAAGRVSVLSPLGAGLLGLKAGDVAHWATPGGEQRAARILAIVFQPEASGDYVR